MKDRAFLFICTLTCIIALAFTKVPVTDYAQNVVRNHITGGFITNGQYGMQCEGEIPSITAPGCFLKIFCDKSSKIFAHLSHYTCVFHQATKQGFFTLLKPCTRITPYNHTLSSLRRLNI